MDVYLLNSARDWRKGMRPRVHLVLAILLSSPLSYGYTVLTHEAIIDSVWDASTRKLLLKRFPGATPEELKQGSSLFEVG
jgi:hypothetical protein